ncbi:MAG: amidohydrolase [Fibrobacteria bacterium]|jgi:cytosine/adenosine deaminase-related metal-dependent hydrolase|nr:amidohydrolase [Fibrobacteria bacterium]
MLYQADWLLNPGSPPVRQGWLRVEGGRIVETGSGNLPEGPSKRFAGCALLPGLVNAHCHLELTTLENALEPGKTFPDWVRDLQGLTADYKLPDYRASARAGIERLLRGGCTTVLDVGNSGEALKALAGGPLRAFACVEALGLDPAHAESRFGNALSLARATEATDRFRPGIAPHAPYSCSVELLRSVIGYQQSRGLPVTIHAAESREEAALFASASGPMQAFCKRIYPRAPEHRGTTPIRWLESEGLLPDGALVIHGNTLEDRDMEILARREATVVHCPSSHAFFGHPRFPYDALRAHGVPVCLGTDSLASADSLSMLEQMRLFSKNHPEVAAEEILRMATEAGARALGLGDVAGRLAAGLQADFILARPDGSGRHAMDDPAAAVLASGTFIEQVLIAGVLA